METAAGLAIGLLAAFLQSCSYVVSASYARGSGKPAWTLLAPSFAAMGVFAAALMPFAWPDAGAPRPDWPRLLPFAAACILMCMAGNGAMFFLLRRVDSSRASPLLALKVPILAVAGVAATGRNCTAAQWCAVALVVLSAFLLAGAGRRVTAGAWAWLLAACASFCASDGFITASCGACSASFGGSVARYSIFAACVIYVAGGLFSLAALAAQGLPPRRVWIRWALPYAVFWFLAMIALFVCFALCGLVLGNIVQSARGLVSVALGWAIARSGRTGLEENVPASVVARRTAAALLVVAAMALYAAGKAT